MLNAHKRLFLLASMIDSTGGGLWRPVAIFYLVLIRELDIAKVGFSLTAGAIIALLIAGLPAGLIADGLGPSRAILLGCVVRFLSFPWMTNVTSTCEIAVIVMFVSIGDRLFWCASPGAVRIVFSEENAQLRAFAIINSCRNIGLGLGALFATFLISKDGMSVMGAWLIIWGNSLSYLIAGLIISIVIRLNGQHDSEEHKWRWATLSAFEDRKYMAFVVLVAILLLAGKSIEIALPYYFMVERSFPSWLASFAFIGLCFGIPCFQSVSLRLGKKWGCFGALAWSAFLQAIGYGTIFFLSGDFFLQIIMIGMATLLLSLSEAILGSQIGTAILLFSRPGYEGRYSAILQFAFAGTAVFAPLLFTQLLSFSSAVLWGGLAVSVTLGGTGFMLLHRYQLASHEVR